MFGFFKNLFSKSASPPPAAAPMTAKAAKPAQPAVPARPRPPMASMPPGPARAPGNAAPAPPVPVRAAAAAPAAAPRLAPKLHSATIELPLNEVLLRLPNDLAAQVLARPDVMFSLSTNSALDQLRTGAIRIPFAQLRKGSPPGTFVDISTHDDSLIDLPLPLILAALGPAGLARRPNQKRAVVSDEVPAVFGNGRSPLKSPARAVAPVPAAPTAPQPAVPIPPQPAKPVVPPAAAPIVPQQAAPIVRPPTPLKPTTSLAAVSAAPKIPSSLPVSSAAGKASAPLPFAKPRLVPPPPPANLETVSMTIEAVSAMWPDPVRDEIQKLQLAGATLSIPVQRLEPGVKTGRVAFTWAELCGWLSAPPPASAHGESNVELPLRVIAPLFLAKHRAAIPRKVLTVDQELPDLFAGGNRPAVPAPTPAPAPAPEVAAPVAAPNVVAEISGQPSKKDWTPPEIVQRIMSLPGVAGALLVSHDGLLVAGQVSAPLKAETLSAFLPRIFTHSGLCAGEMQLGTLSALRLSAGAASCVIWKAGTLYLAVLGQPGQTLPEAALEQLAGGLA